MAAGAVLTLPTTAAGKMRQPSGLVPFEEGRLVGYSAYCRGTDGQMAILEKKKIKQASTGGGSNR